MKKLLILSLILLCISGISAQTNKKYTYCEIIGRSFSNTKISNISIDFGLEDGELPPVEFPKNEKGKEIKFKSMIQALNFMGERGWVLIETYSLVDMMGDMKYHWVLKKDIE